MTSPPEGTVTLAGLVPAGRPLFIWGARMTGSGVCLIARREGLEVEGFIDSDPSFSGRRVLGRPVYLPARLQEEAVRSRRPFVVISVALKEIGRASCRERV